MPPPDTNGREAMLKIHTAGLKLAGDVDLASLADRLDGYSGADVQLVCRDAAMAPMRAAIAGKSPDEIVALQTKGELEGEITARDFLGAVETTPPSIAPGSLRRFEAWNAEFGCELRAPPVREAEAPAAAPPRDPRSVSAIAGSSSEAVDSQARCAAARTPARARARAQTAHADGTPN